MTKVQRSNPNQSGYSMIEMLFALGLLGLLAGMAIIQINVLKPGLKGDGALRLLMGQFTQARESAITQRRFVQLSLKAPNQVQLIREDTTTTTSRLLLPIVTMEGGVRFGKVSGLPDAPGGYAVIAFDSTNNLKFKPDGTLVDKDGASVNATSFLAIPNQALSARAVAIQGSTGRIRGYKWDGSKWKPV